MTTKSKMKGTKGITLVALVITIIVLLILAGVTLNIVLNGGIIEKSQNAVAKYQDAAQNETELISYMEKQFANARDMVVLDNTEGTANAKVGSGNYAYNNPVVPVGFKTSNAGASWRLNNGIVEGWNDGLVIEDSAGNQFVWVPVDGTKVTYAQHYKIGIKGSPDDGWTITRKDGTTVTEANVASMVSSSKYGGFYIARFEAGIPSGSTLDTEASRNTSGVPVSKANAVPWNYISFTNAKTSAESMYNTTNVKSILITDNMWDATIKWLENSGVNVTTDSREWGNYSDAGVTEVTSISQSPWGFTWGAPENSIKGTDEVSWLLKTGETNYTKRKNIYDLAGNLWEYTNTEVNNGTSYCAARGGYFSYYGICYVAAYRDYFGEGGNGTVGFRVGLYIE